MCIRDRFPRLNEDARALAVFCEGAEEAGDLALQERLAAVRLHGDLLREEPAELHLSNVAPRPAVRAIEAIEQETAAVIERDEAVRRRDEQIAVTEDRRPEAPERLVLERDGRHELLARMQEALRQNAHVDVAVLDHGKISFTSPRRAGGADVASFFSAEEGVDLGALFVECGPERRVAFF